MEQSGHARNGCLRQSGGHRRWKNLPVSSCRGDTSSKWSTTMTGRHFLGRFNNNKSNVHPAGLVVAWESRGACYLTFYGSKMVAFPLATRKNQGNTGLQNAAGKRSQTRAALPKGSPAQGQANILVWPSRTVNGLQSDKILWRLTFQCTKSFPEHRKRNI